MACKNCKEKDTLKKELVKTQGNTPKGIIWFTIVWSVLSVYGLVSVIGDLTKWVFGN